MSRRTKIIILSLAVLLLIGLGVFLFFYLRGGEPAPPQDGTFPAGGDTTFPPETATPTVIGGEGGKKARLVKLADGPVAGAAVGKSGGASLVRYVERATGNVYETAIDAPSPVRLTNTTIPNVTEALWGKTGNSVLLRYLKDESFDITSFAATVRAGTGGTKGELAGPFLPSRIDAASVSPEGREIAYVRREGVRATLIATNWSGSPKIELWRSPLLEWLPNWFAPDKIALLSNPSALSDGMLIYVNRITGERETVLSGIPGLTALPAPQGTPLVYSASPESGLALFLFNKTTHKATALSPVTLPEKCVWNAKGARVYCGVPKELPEVPYPDSWYQGFLSFSDDLWEFDTAGGFPKLLESLSVPLDIMHPALTSDESYLIFENKKDGSLWSYRLTDTE